MKLYSAFFVIAFLMVSGFTLHKADVATEHWTKPLTKDAFIAEVKKTVEFRYSYND